MRTILIIFLLQENDRIKNSKDDLREQLLQHRNILDSQVSLKDVSYRQSFANFDRTNISCIVIDFLK